MISRTFTNSISKNSPCSYLEGKTATTHYHFGDVSTWDYQNMLENGWRRFGRLFFATRCGSCDACKGLRVLVNEFEASRNHKKVINKNRNTKVLISKPKLTSTHTDLYLKYHRFKNQTKGWTTYSKDDEEYFFAFVDGARDFGYEFKYFVDDKLIGVSLVDILPMGVSAIYCYYDPDFENLSIGTFNILTLIDFARKNGFLHLYLGVYVEQNSSLNYKSRFVPFELLDDFDLATNRAIWVKSTP